jgi:hypothetical protein
MLRRGAAHKKGKGKYLTEIPQNLSPGSKIEMTKEKSLKDSSLRPKVSSLDMPDPSVHPYWLSTEARKVFAPKVTETVLEGTGAQIKIQQEANKMHMSYQNVLDNQQGQT